jgi:hypothetical protein
MKFIIDLDDYGVLWHTASSVTGNEYRIRPASSGIGFMVTVSSYSGEQSSFWSETRTKGMYICHLIDKGEMTIEQL